MQKDVLPTTKQSYRQAAQVLGRAFADEPVSVAVFKKFSLEGRIRALTNDFSDELLLCIQKGIHPVQVNEDGKVIASAVIYPPGAYPLSAPSQWLLLLKSFVRNGFYDIRDWMRWLEEVDKIHPHKPHYYLEYIGVEPKLQGKSIGSTIMQHLISKADEESVGCYLENANPRNLAFYKRFGFQVIEEKEILDLPAWFMWREPDVR
jgi:ribosomal protein S18 acetylase RimI-like enzyme